MRSTSAERAAISSPRLTPCARSASLNCAPIDRTGFSAFIALCMTTDMSRQRVAASCLSVSPTRFLPLNRTLPPSTRAGGASSWAIANSSVDLPQPDSPTMPRNSPLPTVNDTSSTARTLPRSRTYSTDRPLTSSTGSGTGGLDTLAPYLPYRPQGRVPDLVERVVQQGERRAEQRDARPGRDGPQVLPGLQRLVVLGPVEHRAPARGARVTEADELEAGGEQHGVQRVGEERGQQQRGHRGQDLDADDIERPLAADSGRREEVLGPQAERLRPQLARGIRPAGQREHRDQHQRARAVHVGGDDDEQREQRDDEQHVGDQAQHAVRDATQVRGRHADDRRDRGRQEPRADRDDQHLPGAPHHLREDVLAVGGCAERVGAAGPEAAGIDLSGRAVVRDQPGEQPEEAEEEQQQRAGCRLPVPPDGAPDASARGARRDVRRGRGHGGGGGHGYDADLVRGSNIAVAMSASRIATSTTTVMSRNSACISG